IVVHTMAWQKLEMSKLQVLPNGGKPLSLWAALDEACVQIVDAVRHVIETLPAEIIVKAGARGDGHAKSTLAFSYLLGQVVGTNHDKAVHWMVQAAEAGEDRFTWFMTATVLENRDPVHAVAWMG